jgi:hypothetical protein
VEPHGKAGAVPPVRDRSDLQLEVGSARGCTRPPQQLLQIGRCAHHAGIAPIFSPPDRSDTLVCEDGNDKAVVSKEIPFTDFPLDAIELWFANSIIYLPSEH